MRGGYGIFYNRTILGALDDTLEFGKYTTSATVTFPTNSADPGPTAGRLPTNPYLVNGPVVNRTLLNQAYPPGVPVRNDGVVLFNALDGYVGGTFPVPIVDNSGGMTGWAYFHLVDIEGAPDKVIRGYFVSPVNAEKLVVTQGGGTSLLDTGVMPIRLTN